MTTTKKKRTTKPRTKKVEAVVDHDGHDIVEEIKEPEVPAIPKHTIIYIEKRLATKDKIDPVGQLGFSEKQNRVTIAPTYAYQNELQNFAGTGYTIDGIDFPPYTRDWWENLPNSGIIPSTWRLDFNKKMVMDEI